MDWKRSIFKRCGWKRCIRGLVLPLCVLFGLAGPAVSSGVEGARAPVVNINTADVATLSAMLQGVGESKARAIIQYREQHGPFASVDQLIQVNGIGPALLEVNRSRVAVE